METALTVLLWVLVASVGLPLIVWLIAVLAMLAWAFFGD